VSSRASGVWAHKARRAGLFPLPQLAVRQTPSASSARVRTRQQLRRTVTAVTNRCIDALNRMYHTSSLSSCTLSPPSAGPHPASVPRSPHHQSDNRTSKFAVSSSNTAVRAAAPHPFPSGTEGFPASASRAQQRLLSNVHQHCADFVSRVRAASVSAGGSDGESRALDVLASFHSEPSLVGRRFVETSSASSAVDDGLDSLQTGLPQLSAPFYSSHTTSVPLIARRVALPSDLNVVPLARVLPPDLATRYDGPTSPLTLARPIADILRLDAEQPLAPARIAGSRAQYVALIGRMIVAGMIGFTDSPLAVNGVFAVRKDADADRLIIDARPANRLFVDSPHVELANPSHLVQLQVPAGARMHTGKSDLSNFYHHLGLPRWMQPFFCLPPLSDEELRSLGLDPRTCGGHFPMCLTLPMGFSHAVFLAQQAHLHVLYGSKAVQEEDNLIHRPCATALSLEQVVHGVVIDDFFLFALDPQLAKRTFERVLAAYAAAGFVVKPSKVVSPTTAAVKVIGFDIGGPDSLVQLPADSMQLLLQHTLAVLQRGTCTGLAMAHLIGRWTWCMLLRRPSLSLMQRVYRFIELAGRRRFHLWPSVRRELWLMLGIAPLLCARLDAPMHHRVVASDASQLAAGVVSAAVTPELHRYMGEVCSSRMHAAVQPVVASHIGQDCTMSVPSDSFTAAAVICPMSNSNSPGHESLSAFAYETVRRAYDRFYSLVKSNRWSPVLSTPWRVAGHINTLELRAVALALHWLLSYPSTLGRRVFLLVDSTVALFSLLKGRSSAPSLLFVLRKIGALLLASSISFLAGWVPSAVNPADAPSRLSDPSAADSLAF
jgi:hypothetical protein